MKPPACTASSEPDLPRTLPAEPSRPSPPSPAPVRSSRRRERASARRRDAFRRLHRRDVRFPLRRKLSFEIQIGAAVREDQQEPQRDDKPKKSGEDAALLKPPRGLRNARRHSKARPKRRFGGDVTKPQVSPPRHEKKKRDKDNRQRNADPKPSIKIVQRFVHAGL